MDDADRHLPQGRYRMSPPPVFFFSSAPLLRSAPGREPRRRSERMASRARIRGSEAFGARRPRAARGLEAGPGTGSADRAEMSTAWSQKTVCLPSYPRGCHVITRHLLHQLDDLRDYEVGLAHFFVMHTSASLTINENASPDVPLDLEDALNRIVPEGNMYRHLDEGLDDMPAHVKSSLMGCSLTVPISAGRLCLGTWQGIYLNEHRDHGGSRTIVVTLQGRKRSDGRRYG